MGSDDYTVASIGGSLKLKGVKDAGISKRKKKRKRPKPENESESETKAGGTSAREQKKTDVERASEENILEAEASGEEGKEGLEDGTPGRGKTEAERRHEEAKRKRLDERLKREGIKTHKERVEELNRYLSNLSEHHDMYVLLALGLLRNTAISGHKRASAVMKSGVRTEPVSSWALEGSKNEVMLLLMRIPVGPESDQDNGIVVFMRTEHGLVDYQTWKQGAAEPFRWLVSVLGVRKHTNIIPAVLVAA